MNHLKKQKQGVQLKIIVQFKRKNLKKRGGTPDYSIPESHMSSDGIQLTPRMDNSLVNYIWIPAG